MFIFTQLFVNCSAKLQKNEVMCTIKQGNFIYGVALNLWVVVVQCDMVVA